MHANIQLIIKTSQDAQVGLNECLKIIFENEDIQDKDPSDFISIKYNNKLDEEKSILGIELLLDFFDNPQNIVHELCTALSRSENVITVTKFWDSSMEDFNKKYFTEIFGIEMQLRETITYIFVDTYKKDFFNLLKESAAKIQKKDKENLPSETDFRTNFENEFFFLLFSDYIQILDKKEIDHKGLMRTLSEKFSWDEFRSAIVDSGVKEERYVDFINSIKNNVQVIENVRNCIAHNRTLSESLIENYGKAKNELLEKMHFFWRSRCPSCGGEIEETTENTVSGGTEDDPEPTEYTVRRVVRCKNCQTVIESELVDSGSI